jgi:hypothetical protein
MEIKILGPSCINCLKLELLTAQALKELGQEARIVKVADDREISQFSEQPPILVIDNKVAHAGLPLPTTETLIQWISQ